MSITLAATVYSRHALDDDALVAVDRVLRMLARNLHTTIKGKKWRCDGGDARINVEVEDLETPFCDWEDELLELEMLTEPGMFRVVFVADVNRPDARREIDRLSRATAEAIDGATLGARSYS